MQCDFLFPTPVWHDDIKLDVDSLISFAVPLMNPNPMEYGSYESGYINAAGYRDSKCVVGNFIRQVEDMAQGCFQELGPLDTYCEMDFFWFTWTPQGNVLVFILTLGQY